MAVFVTLRQGNVYVLQDSAALHVKQHVPRDYLVQIANKPVIVQTEMEFVIQASVRAQLVDVQLASSINNLIISATNSSVTVAWDSYVDVDRFTVEYKLLNTDQCRTESGPREVANNGPEKTVTISGLTSHSTYKIFVSSVGACLPCANNKAEMEITTSETGALLDFTCFSNFPLLNPEVSSNVYIGGYRSGNDLDANVDFSRVIDLGNGNGLQLPTGSTQKEHPSNGARLLEMPKTAGKERIGAFNCEAEKGSKMQNVTILVHHIQGDPTSNQRTVVGSIGDSLSLEVDVTSSGNFYWNKDGSIIPEWSNQKTVTINQLGVTDAGIYDCYLDNERNEGKQAIIRVIVRECEGRRWNPPACNKECEFCYNGGICHDGTGECICAPGFSGLTCQTLHGRNRFGRDGNLYCKGGGAGENDLDGCKGNLICPLDPFGCSCAAGFSARDCNTACTKGSFGADCKQTCHCANGNGVCDTGIASSINNLIISATNSSVTVAWDSYVDVDRFTVEYKLLNTDQCRTESGPREVANNGPEKTVTISGLTSHSTYKIFVSSVSAWPPCANNNGEIEIDTLETAPSKEPVNLIIKDHQNDALTFDWDIIECGSRGGSLEYYYEINTTPPKDGITSQTQQEISNLTPCTSYEFKVEAFTSARNGPEIPDVLGLSVSKVPNESDKLDVSWVLDPCAEQYYVSYQLINRDQCDDSDVPMVPFWSGMGTSVTIDSLLPYSTYSVAVRAENSLGKDEDLAMDTTYITAPTASPANVRNSSRTNTSLSFEWDRVPCGKRGGSNMFLYELSDVNSNPIDSDSTADKFVTFWVLSPCTEYRFRVKASNDVGDGAFSNYVIWETDIGVLGPVKNIETSVITSDTWTLLWDEQTESKCATDEYSIKYALLNKDQCEHYTDPVWISIDNVPDTTVQIPGLLPHSTYRIVVYPVNDLGVGEENSFEDTTKESAPSGPPESLTAVHIGKDFIWYEWDQPECGSRNGIIRQYTYELTPGEQGSTYDTAVTIRTVGKPYDDTFVPPTEPDMEEDVPGDTQQYTFFDLHPSTEYEIQVAAYTEAGMGEFIEERFYTAPANNEQFLGVPLDKPESSGYTGTTVIITIPQVDENNVEIYVTDYQIRVEDPKADVINVYLFKTMRKSYIAGIVEVDNVKDNPVHYIVGEEGSSNNPLLQNGRDYLISIGTCSSINDKTKERQNSNQPNDSIGLKADSTKSDESIAQNNPTSTSREPRGASAKQTDKPGPVSVTDLKDYVRKKKSREDYSFKHDYKLLPQGILFDYEASKKANNREKNRYANIVTYDHSRVTLRIQGNDPDSDYINASYIDGYKAPNKYIASQGPNEASMADFWRMMWENNMSKIVMVTNLTESGKIKCEKYWPDKAERYGNFTVTFVNKEVLVDYTIRHFTITDATIDGFPSRPICQFHYTTWPDFSVPENSSAFLNFVKVVNNYGIGDSHPTVVHCSAGVGRTGTFIAIESLMRQAKQENQVDVFGFVSGMRNSRMQMIQTHEQYEFIYDALLEHIVFGDTSIPISAFRNTYKNLQIRDPETNLSALAIQFQNLQDITILPKPDECKAGAAEENVDKNRFKDVLPMDSARPYLMTEGGAKSTNYINASFMNGYRTKDGFLTTQMPLPNTVDDIWRMVFDYKCNTIVMLNQLDSADKTLAQYWPNKGAKQTHGPLTVECVSEQKIGKDVVTRKLKLRKMKEEREIVQFALKNWSNDGKKLPDKKSIGQLATRVIERMQKQKKDARVAVHCIDGMSVSGTFIAIVSALDRLAAERSVDIFQTLKRLRTCNGRCVATKKHFKFVYDAVLENVEESGQTYENFTV
ncbi:receptor-type tyrosine-protein phosphatase S-like [Amphiura filiformis]|uniref:receptor-type tyrosine-protein phosphatase S-like n=1 Tax=Amphiura filiformis TaxID=82378 RepID=UPI003B225495